MNDLVALLIPCAEDSQKVLLMDMHEDFKLLIESKEGNKIAFLDKLTSIKRIYSKKLPKDNSQNCLFLPFFTSKTLKIDDSEHQVKEMLAKISKNPPNLKGHVVISKRFVFDQHIKYTFVLFHTDPVSSKDLKIKKAFWCNKDTIKTFQEENNLFIMGNEIEEVLQLKNDRHKDTSPPEYRVTPYSTKDTFGFLKKSSLLHKVVIQTNSDQFVQHYIFADFMMNSYPCQVMSYPQFIGFAVARGFYMKRCKRLFEVFKSDLPSKLTFDEFLFGCICMDLSSPHEGHLREARGNLIFKYYDYDHDSTLNFPEMRCLVSRMMKKSGLKSTLEEVTEATEHIMKLLNKNTKVKIMKEAKISLKEFQMGLHLQELQGLTHLLRFSMPYLVKTRALMERYIQSIKINDITINELDLTNQNLELIPYFIKEAYSTENLFKSMIHYSTSYSTVQSLLEKMDESNKILVAKKKMTTIFSVFSNQVFYYLSEIAFDIYNSETLFPLRNPIFLMLLFTAISIADPQMFHSSVAFWNSVQSFFIFNLPSFILALRRYNRGELEESSDSPALDNGHWTNKHKELQKRRRKVKENDHLTLLDFLSIMKKKKVNDSSVKNTEGKTAAKINVQVAPTKSKIPEKIKEDKQVLAPKVDNENKSVSVKNDQKPPIKSSKDSTLDQKHDPKNDYLSVPKNEKSNRDDNDTQKKNRSKDKMSVNKSESLKVTHNLEERKEKVIIELPKGKNSKEKSELKSNTHEIIVEDNFIKPNEFSQHDKKMSEEKPKVEYQKDDVRSYFKYHCRNKLRPGCSNKDEIESSTSREKSRGACERRKRCDSKSQELVNHDSNVYIEYDATCNDSFKRATSKNHIQIREECIKMESRPSSNSMASDERCKNRKGFGKRVRDPDTVIIVTYDDSSDKRHCTDSDVELTAEEFTKKGEDKYKYCCRRKFARSKREC